MKKFHLILIGLTLFLPACSKEIQNNDNKETPPAQVQINRSKVEAEVIEINKNSETDFTIKAVILSVEADNAYPSIAAVNEEYTLTPAFRLDDNKNVDKQSDVNKDLSNLSKLQKGDKLRAIITYNTESGWNILEVLK